MRSQRRGKAVRDEKRIEAEARNATWRALTPAAQLAELNKRGVAARRQRKRLEKVA